MTPWLYLVLAFALGWLIGFLIDWWFWRGRGAQMQASLDACRADGAKLRTDLDGTRQQLASMTTDLQAARADNDNLRLQLTKDSQGLVAPGLAAAGGAALGAAVASEEDVAAYKRQIADLEAKVEVLQNDLNATREDRWRLRDEAVAAAGGAAVGAAAVAAGKEKEEEKPGASPAAKAMVAGATLGAAAAAGKEKEEEKPGASPAAKATVAGATLGAAAAAGKKEGDDLEIIEGIGPRIAELLRASGITTFAQLAATPQSELQAILDKGGPAFNRADPETWPEQAALAAKGDTEGLKKLQAQLIGGRRIKADDLEIIEGIGPRIAELLRASGITTFAQLAATPQSELQAILDKGGPAFNRADPETWPEQAALAAKGDTEGLAKLQAELVGGRRLKPDDLTIVEGIGPKIAELLRANGIITFRQLAATDPAQLKAILVKGGPAFNYADPETWPEQADLLARGETARFNALAAELVAGRRRGDNLGALQGMNPALVAALGAQGIKSYKQLAATDRASLEAVLAEAGSTTSGLDYDTLSEQATLAAAGDWDLLKDYQDRLKADASATPDDLIVIEGIGPKINEVFNAAGIRTYWRLWHTTPQTLRAILDAAGPQYRIADPTTWPEQAALLAKGDRAAFDVLVARLVAGREPGAETVAQTTARPADDLSQIRGIGPSIAKALNAAGIATYEDLAAQTPERLREIATPIAGPNVEVQGWIVRARELSNDPSRR